MSENKFKALVLDSGAFINHASILNSAEEYYSIEEVMNEVRDKYARESLDRFPFEIKLRHPSKEAIDIVEKFAKSTGDFSRLAQTDLLIIALTYDLQKEVGGVDNVNINCLFDRNRIVDVREKRIVGVNVSAEPCKYVNTEKGCSYGVDCIYRHPGDLDRSALEKKAPVQPIPKKEEDTSPKPSTPLRKWNVVQPATIRIGTDDQFPSLSSLSSAEKEEQDRKLYNNPEIKAIFALHKEGEDDEEAEEVNEEGEEAGEAEEVNEEGEEAGEEGEEAGEAEEVKEEGEEAGEAEEVKEEAGEAEVPLSQPEHSQTTGSHIHVNSYSLVDSQPSEVSNENEGEWIDSTSLSSFYDNSFSSKKEEEDSLDRSQYAACCTGDYAMQNVLLQMNLQLVSYDNKHITNLRIFTRRCRDCFAICKDETKLFCSECGHPSLAKVPVYVMKGGIVRVGMPYESKSLRGTKYSIGKNADLLYCEDQLHSGKWLRRVQNMKRAKKEGCIFGDVGAESIGLENSTSRSNDYLDSIVVGFGRRNPNAMKGREKRGKKKAKKASRY